MKRWKLAQELFEETVALEAPERDRVLQERCAGDPELVRQVQAWVAADARPHRSLEGTASELLYRLRQEEPPAEGLCAQSFGSYVVEEHLSSGGMAHVYRATRTSAGTERRVALKVLRPGLDSDSLLRRFQFERETLAALEHEHIVSFLDGGALPDGRPYLVMEYVEGRPLTQWADGVPVRARLAVFLRVLAAVQYAHHKLVVHRDLKPSNVLVTARGMPKLLDFGVATVPEFGKSGVVAPLTPVYASPEQLRGEGVTTASDIYSLGLLLHELVFGERSELGASPLASLPAPHRSGDLHAIVRKALEVDPARRYRSADHFAEDLRRYLAHEPVSARPASAAYRTRLFVRRHRARLILAILLSAALTTGWIASDLRRRRAEQEASLGWGAHAQAKAVARVFERWIATEAAADPERGARATEYLERAVREELGHLPEAETLLRMALAQMYLERGELELAGGHVERAWELARLTRGIGAVERERVVELRRRVAEGL